MRLRPSRMKPKKSTRQAVAGVNPTAILTEVREIILSARQTVARGVDTALVALYWKVGQRIRTEILREKRAEYGEEIVSTLSQQLTTEFGNGFSRFNLSRMIQFAEARSSLGLLS